MDLFDQILLAVAKILFVVIVAVGAFAPVLLWAERRQSAMMQDRVGPHRAHVPLPAALVGALRATLKPLQAGIFGSFFASGLSIVALLIMLVSSRETLFGQPAETYYLALVGFGILGVLLRIGHRIHGGIVANDGKLELLGLLHPLADAIKMIFKEDFVPPKADKFLHAAAPIVALATAIAAFAVIPFSDVLYPDCAGDVLSACGADGARTAIPMQIATLDIGVLFLFGVASLTIVGVAIAGYSSDNKYSLMGGIRAASQMVSYEVAIGLTIVPCFMVYDSVRLEDMVVWQYEAGIWGIFIPPLTLSCILYLFAAIAETKRVPFDLPEGESELVGGYLTEYSGMKFGMFFAAEFVEVVVLGALATVLFFGGWDVPFLYRDGFDLPGTWELTIPMTQWVISDTIPLQHWGVITIQLVAFLLKIVVLMWFQLMIRWTLPRFRYDQIMKLCWKGVLPLAIANVLLTGILVLLWT